MGEIQKPHQNNPASVVHSQSLVYSAPLPTSQEFNGYEQALPGAANRILAMVENEAAHRHSNDNKIVQESVKLSTRGQIFAFILALISLTLIFVSMLKGQPLAAIVPAIIAVCSLAAVFLGKKQ